MPGVEAVVDRWAGVDRQRLPRHVAVIMDGNRRWALQRRLPGKSGHRAGRETLRELIKDCVELGIPYLTVYAFSTENWKRPPDEVSFLWKLFREAIVDEIERLCRNGVRLRFIGELQELAPDLRQSIEEAESRTAMNSNLVLNVALNYGGRREVVAAARKLVEAALQGQLEPADLDEATFAAQLYTAGQPDPDLSIRTSGEHRISNYLLWQLAYAEIHVTETFWPDFRSPDLRVALLDYQGRDRRFGARP